MPIQAVMPAATMDQPTPDPVPHLVTEDAADKPESRVTLEIKAAGSAGIHAREAATPEIPAGPENPAETRAEAAKAEIRAEKGTIEVAAAKADPVEMTQGAAIRADPTERVEGTGTVARPEEKATVETTKVARAKMVGAVVRDGEIKGVPPGMIQNSSENRTTRSYASVIFFQRPANLFLVHRLRSLQIPLQWNVEYL